MINIDSDFSDEAKTLHTRTINPEVHANCFASGWVTSVPYADMNHSSGFDNNSLLFTFTVKMHGGEKVKSDTVGTV